MKSVNLNLHLDLHKIEEIDDINKSLIKTLTESYIPQCPHRKSDIELKISQYRGFREDASSLIYSLKYGIGAKLWFDDEVKEPIFHEIYRAYLDYLIEFSSYIGYTAEILMGEYEYDKEKDEDIFSSIDGMKAEDILGDLLN